MEKVPLFLRRGKKNRMQTWQLMKQPKRPWTLHWQNQATHPGWTSITYPRRPALSLIKVPWFQPSVMQGRFRLSRLSSPFTSFLWSAGVWGGFPCLPLSKLFDASENLAMVTTISTPVIFWTTRNPWLTIEIFTTKLKWFATTRYGPSINSTDPVESEIIATMHIMKPKRSDLWGGWMSLWIYQEVWNWYKLWYMSYCHSHVSST